MAWSLEVWVHIPPGDQIILFPFYRGFTNKSDYGALLCVICISLISIYRVTCQEIVITPNHLQQAKKPWSSLMSNQNWTGRGLPPCPPSSTGPAEKQWDRRIWTCQDVVIIHNHLQQASQTLESQGGRRRQPPWPGLTAGGLRPRPSNLQAKGRKSGGKKKEEEKRSKPSPFFAFWAVDGLATTILLHLDSSMVQQDCGVWILIPQWWDSWWVTWKSPGETGLTRILITYCSFDFFSEVLTAQNSPELILCFIDACI